MTNHSEDPREIWTICFTNRNGFRLAWANYETEEEARLALADVKAFPSREQPTIRHYVMANPEIIDRPRRKGGRPPGGTIE